MRKLEKRVIIGNSAYIIKLGGIHSGNPPAIYEKNNDYKLILSDVSSFYPAIVSNLNIKPDHLSERFTDLYKVIFKDRMKAKQEGNKVKSDALKISANATIGKFKMLNNWLYDPQAFYSVTLNGQLFLLILIERLENEGFPVIYANTDGIICKVKDEIVFKEICNYWCKKYNFKLDHEEYQKCIIKDVNNYILQSVDGTIKEKGCFVTHRNKMSIPDRLKDSYDMPIVAEALHQYFIHDIPVEKAVKECNDIFAFCKSQKVGSQFQVEYHHLKNNQKQIDILQKTNRYYVSVDGGKLYKRKYNKKKKREELTELVAGKTIRLFNSYHKSDNYEIAYNYYIQQANSIIEVLKPSQMTLF